MLWPDQRLCDLLGIEHPIIQAPMAGTTRPELVAVVSNAGGLGSHGCATLSPDQLEADIAQLARLTNQATNLNFFCHQPPVMTEDLHNALLTALDPHYKQAGVEPPVALPKANFTPFGDDELALLLRHPPSVVSFHFGLPDGEAVPQLKQAGCKILSSATTVDEARWLEERGVDAIIAQGWEAGGHRGVFLDLEGDAQIGLFALLPQIVDAVDVPVIAAGGIADGRGIAAALTLGASGVQLGTAFITSDQANPKPVHATAVSNGHDNTTLISRSVSGRPARAHRTDWLDTMAALPSAPFPLMYHYVGPLIAKDAERHQFSLYGQSAALSPSGDAAKRMADLIDQTQAVLAPPR